MCSPLNVFTLMYFPFIITYYLLVCFPVHLTHKQSYGLSLFLCSLISTQASTGQSELCPDLLSPYNHLSLPLAA
jgi:hypothetical protein